MTGKYFCDKFQLKLLLGWERLEAEFVVVVVVEVVVVVVVIDALIFFSLSAATKKVFAAKNRAEWMNEKNRE